MKIRECTIAISLAWASYACGDMVEWFELNADCVDRFTPILLTVGGEFHSQCVPQQSTFLWNSNIVAVFVEAFTYPGQTCQQVSTPWTQTGVIGPLAAGEYYVYGTLVISCLGYPVEIFGPEVLDSFTVSESACLGDMNCDALFNHADVNRFVLALASPATYIAANPHCEISRADCNADGVVDFADIDAFIAIVTQ